MVEMLCGSLLFLFPGYGMAEGAVVRGRFQKHAADRYKKRRQTGWAIRHRVG